jgi:hypothetical protein
MTRRSMILGLAAGAVCAGLAACQLLPEWSVGEAARRAWSLLHAHQPLYWGLGYAALASLVLQVALPLLLPRVADRAPWWNSRVVFGLLTIATVLLLRWPWLAHRELNPDESEELAIALTLRDDPRYWIAAEGQTHGPLVAYVLLPVQLFGLQLEYGSARLVGLGLLLGSLFFHFGTLRSFFPESISRAVVTPATISVAFWTSWDYVAYNAEHPAVFLLCGGGYGCSRLAAGPAGGTFWRALATGLALGLVPFTKLQGVPLGLVLAGVALVCLVVRFRGQVRKQRAAVLTLCAGGLAPAALTALYLWFHDRFAHFWTSYINANLIYTHHGGPERKATGLYESFRDFPNWAAQASDELFFPYFHYTIGAGLLLMGLLHLGRKCWGLLLAGGAVLLASVYSVVLPGTGFTHYLLFLLFPLAFLAAVVLAAFHEAQPRYAARVLLVAVCLVVPPAIPLLRAHNEDNPWLATEPDPTDAVAQLIRYYASPGEKLVVWGWMDRYYVLTGMRQGTLHPNTVLEIDAGSQTSQDEYFYWQFLELFDQAKAPVFVDAASPGSWGFSDRDRFGHEKFPALHERIVARYALVGEEDGGRVYVLKERLAKLPADQEAAIAVVPSDTHRIEWKNGIGKADRQDSFLVFTLRKAQWVSTIRITCAYEGTGPPANFRLFWKRDDQENFVEGQKIAVRVQKGSGNKNFTLPVNDAIGQIRIHPDTQPCVLTIKEIVLQAPSRPLTENEKYERVVERVRNVVSTALPKGAIVLVLSDRGEEDLLQLPPCKAQDFPQNLGGSHFGYLPAGGSAEIITQLERLRANGAQFLLVPATYNWWLDDKIGYKKFKNHLEKHYKAAVREPDACIIFDLRSRKP